MGPFRGGSELHGFNRVRHGTGLRVFCELANSEATLVPEFLDIGLLRIRAIAQRFFQHDVHQLFLNLSDSEALLGGGIRTTISWVFTRGRRGADRVAGGRGVVVPLGLRLGVFAVGGEEGIHLCGGI